MGCCSRPRNGASDKGQDWRTFWITNGVQMLPTGARTPWPNRAETAVRLFKQQLAKVCEEARIDKSLALLTARDV
eukprot:988554-Amphidinium_carterae.1